MKIFYILLTTLYPIGLFSQIAIGTSMISSPSVLLEFGNEPRGIILPWVDNIQSVSGAVPGTLVYDTNDHKVKYLKGGAGSSWIDLSIDTTGVADTSMHGSLTDLPSSKVIMGSAMAAAPGILVLESQDKALLLPRVDTPHQSIINPSAGMIVYDTKRKQLATFNGTIWTFWTYSN